MCCCCFSYPKVLVELLRHFDSFLSSRNKNFENLSRWHIASKVEESLPLPLIPNSSLFSLSFFLVFFSNTAPEQVRRPVTWTRFTAISPSLSESAFQSRESAFLGVFVVAAANAAAAQPSNPMPRYRTLFRRGFDGDTDVDYFFWEVSLAAPTSAPSSPNTRRPPPPTTHPHHHKQITVNHWKMRVKHTADMPQIIHCYRGCNCPLSDGLTQRMQ